MAMFAKEATAAFQKRLVDGRPFPLLLTPSLGSGLVAAADEVQAAKEDFIRAVASQRDWIDSRLAESGAILFRGFPVSSPQDFGRLVDALGWQEYDYSAEGGSASRTSVCHRVYTVNDTLPLDTPIGFHSEACYLKEFPTRLLFFCEVPPEPETGGETIIAHGHVVYRRLLEERKAFVEELLDKGYRYRPRLHSALPAFRKNRQGCISWFNTFGVYVVNHGQLDELVLGNEEAISREDVNACMKILEEEKIKLPWQKGDVVLIDNTAVVHGREACFGPVRGILISLTK